MSIKLSHDTINSFCGDIICLRLIGEDDLSDKGIVWGAEDDTVGIHSFSGDEPYSFNDGVLISLNKVGNSAVYAIYNGVKYICKINSRKMRKASKNDKLDYFVGDFHAHTSHNHNYETFPLRESELPIDMLNKVKEDNKLDFFAISDHAGVISRKDFFRGFTDTEASEPMDTVVFPGCESQVNAMETDRFGILRKNGGEIVTVNATNYCNVDTYEEFYDAFKDSPCPIASLAHPQAVGYSNAAWWSFMLQNKRDKKFQKIIKLVEMGNGGDREGNIIYEYIYSLALDNGFKIAPCSTSDSHGPRWGYNSFPGKTVILAPEKSKELFLDALINNRVYATESGNVKLYYTVNGKRVGETLEISNTYTFHIEISQFYEDASSFPIKLQVISDYGKCVKYVENLRSGTFEFNIESDSARYFFLRLIDEKGRRCWSAPVWTGRDFDEPDNTEFIPLEKKFFTAQDITTGKSAATIINDNPRDTWFADSGMPEIVIDMGKVENICAVGHYPRVYSTEITRSPEYFRPNYDSEYVSGYELYLSENGIDYKICADGLIRDFAQETFITFKKQNARFVKFKVISSTGKACGLEKYADKKVCIGELSIYKD